MNFILPKRPRRNRKNESIRSLVRENSLSASNLVMPLFVIEGESKRNEIKSMPGIFRLSIDCLVEECGLVYSLGIPAVAPFPVLESKFKDNKASQSTNDNGLYQRAIRAIKSNVPELIIFSDTAMDPYNSDGHDGLLSDRGEILNDETLPILAKMALSQANAGADVVALSDMMDGRVKFIRDALDKAGFHNTSILSYAVKYASSFYGPFRDALDSAPRVGDKKTYQMDTANSKEAIREVLLDIEEGADFIMVKPGLPFLDVLHKVCQVSTVPVAAYNVSGEYAMLKAAGLNGWLDYKSAVLETLLSFKRAGANFIFTYHAKEAAQWLRAK